MKELSIEEKAKRYDEAIERAKGLVDFCSDNELKTLEFVFPELKESEDERIRKSIINLVIKSAQNGGMALHKWESQQMLAWLEKQDKLMEALQISNSRIAELVEEKYNLEEKLEKQGNQNPYSGVTFDYNGHTWGMCARDGGVEILMDGELKAFLSLDKSFVYPVNPIPLFKAKNFYVSKVDGLIHDMTYNPADKVEPKFKVGDWIVNNINKEIFLIKSFNNGCCTLEDTKGRIYSPCLPPIEDDNHLWTIQDAKDGDVLVIQKTDVTYESIFIFKKIENNRIIQYLHYFTTDTGEEVCEARTAEGFLGFVGNTVHPATKEQRDTLMKAMTNAGWEFNFEKKELKMIVNPIFNIGDTIAKKHNSNIHNFSSFTITDIIGGKYWYNDRIICDISEQDEWELYKPVRQNPAWSEEDKRNLNDAILFIETGTYSLDKDNLINWLKSFKERFTWTPSKKHLDALEVAIAYMTDESSNVLKELLEQLKKLK